MSKIKKRASVFIMCLMAVALCIPVNAAIKGNLTFTHGIRSAQTQTYGGIKSTVNENSMRITGTVTVTAPKKASFLPDTGTQKICKALECQVGVGKTKGSSSFVYYVDGTKKHTSTAPWQFDFR